MRIALAFRALLTGLALLAAPAFDLPASAARNKVPTDEARFTEYVARRFAAEFPDARVSVAGPLALAVALPSGRTAGVNLDRMWRACPELGRRCADGITEFVTNTGKSLVEGDGPIKRAAIRLVVRPKATLGKVGADAAASGEAPPLVTRSFAGDLALVCVADLPHGIQYLNERHLAALGLSAENCVALGRAQLAATLKPTDTVAHPPSETRPFEILNGDEYESSRILLHESWRALAEAMKAGKGALVAAVPESHMIIYGDLTRPGTVEAMRAFAAEVMRSGPRPISSTLFLWTPGGWHPLVFVPTR